MIRELILKFATLERKNIISVILIRNYVLGNVRCEPYIPSHCQELTPIGRKFLGNRDEKEELNLFYSYACERRRNFSQV